MTTPLLNTREAARLLGVKPSTLEKWRNTGGGPIFIKVGVRTIRYAREDLEAFLRRGPNPEDVFDRVRLARREA